MGELNPARRHTRVDAPPSSLRAVETLVKAARGGIALTAFFLLFFAIVNVSAGRYALASATLVVGLAATGYVLRTRGRPAA